MILIIRVIVLVSVIQAITCVRKGPAKEAAAARLKPAHGHIIRIDPAFVRRITTQQGVVAGYYETYAHSSNTGFTKVYTFHNIPYAQPPVGERRFKDPETPNKWTGIWNGTKERGNAVECIQLRHVWGGSNRIAGQEDCLYLSIYTPLLPYQAMNSSERLPVIVYFHGGSFMYGDKQPYDPSTFLANHKFVFVKINYRLGPFGFLSTGDKVVPGNMGLKDQIMALEWIQKNIEAFGGNKEAVTIAGSFAGGASVHFHMLSKKSKGLFHRAISMSGTMLSPWALAEDLPHKTQILANHVGCPVNGSTTMISCLRERPATFLFDAVRATLPIMYNPVSPWAPVVDSFASDPLIPDYPAVHMSSTEGVDIPWLVGVSNAEGFYIGAELLSNPHAEHRISEEWAKLAPFILDYDNTVDPKFSSAQNQIGIAIQNEYMKDASNTQAGFCQMIGDRLFVVDAERSARWMSKSTKAPVYFYYLTAPVTSTTIKEKFLSGAQRLEDFLDSVYFMKTNTKFQSEEEKTIEYMHNVWASFAKDGIPANTNWAVVKPEQFAYLEINSNDNQTLVPAPAIGRRNFWEELPFKEFNRYPNPHAMPLFVDGLDGQNDNKFAFKLHHVPGPIHRNRPGSEGSVINQANVTKKS